MLVIYIVLVVISFLSYPEPFDPFVKTIAQLGNPIINPSGALAYNLAIIITNLPIVLIVGFSLTIWKRKYSETFQRGRFYFYITATFFLLSGVFGMLGAIIPLGINDSLNGIFSIAFFISFQLFVVTSAIGIRGNLNHTNWIPEMGFLVVITNTALFASVLITGYFVAILPATVLSWAYVLAFIYEVT